MDRADQVEIAIIGGGATGLGCAVDAASRGYRTVLFEASEFASGASGRSTKLIHGGVRYLAQRRIGLVREALAERAILRRIAPDLVRPIGIIVPARNAAALAYYAAGLKLYDALAGKANIEPSRILGKAETFTRLPNLKRAGVSGGVRYVDAQFDDRELARELARKARELGVSLHEHARVVGFLKDGGRITGVRARGSAGEEITLTARVTINASGVWVDEVRRLSDPSAKPMLAPSRGSHLVLPERFLGASDGFIIPKTDDGRVIFALPWKGNVLVGTTDIAVDVLDPDPKPTEGEIDYLLAHVNRYLERTAQRADILETFAGLRPLLASGGGMSASLSREHIVDVDAHGLVTIAGGKWTIYRRMAKDAIDAAARCGHLRPAPCVTAELLLCHPERRREAP